MAKPTRSPERAADDEDEDAAAAADAEAVAREAALAERIKSGKAKERSDEPEEPRRPNPEAAQHEEEPEPEEEAVEDPDEVEARRFGWKPESEWKSAKPWQNAKDFLAATFANSRLFEARFDDYQKQQKKETAELKEKLDEAVNIVGQLFRDQKKIRGQEYARARAEIEAERKTAIAEGNVERVEALETQRDELDKLEKEEAPAEKKPETKKEEPKEEVQATPPEVTAWIADNSWFNTDETLRDLARVEEKRLLREEKGITLAKLLEKVTQKVMDTYPDRFENPRRRAPSQVGNPSNRNGGGSPGGKKAHTYENLPPEAKATIDKWVKQGIMTQAAYLKDYEWDL